jgi:hypothetical protein
MAEEFEPVRISTQVAAPVEMITLFTIDDREYKIPKVVPPNIVMQYLQDVVDSSEEYALSHAMQTLLGEEGMQALSECDTVGEEQMGQILAYVSNRLFGAMERLQGKLPRAQRRRRG